MINDSFFTRVYGDFTSGAAKVVIDKTKNEVRVQTEAAKAGEVAEFAVAAKTFREGLKKLDFSKKTGNEIRNFLENTKHFNEAIRNYNYSLLPKSGFGEKIKRVFVKSLPQAEEIPEEELKSLRALLQRKDREEAGTMGPIESLRAKSNAVKTASAGSSGLVTNPKGQALYHTAAAGPMRGFVTTQMNNTVSMCMVSAETGVNEERYRSALDRSLALALEATPPIAITSKKDLDSLDAYYRTVEQQIRKELHGDTRGPKVLLQHIYKVPTSVAKELPDMRGEVEKLEAQGHKEVALFTALVIDSAATVVVSPNGEVRSIWRLDERYLNGKILSVVVPPDHFIASFDRSVYRALAGDDESAKLKNLEAQLRGDEGDVKEGEKLTAQKICERLHEVAKESRKDSKGGEDDILIVASKAVVQSPKAGGA